MGTAEMALKEVRELRAQLEFLRKGGCTCEKPKWHYINIIAMYRCSRCGAVASPRLITDAEREVCRG